MTKRSCRGLKIATKEQSKQELAFHIQLAPLIGVKVTLLEEACYVSSME